MKSREAPSTGASQQNFTTTSGRYIVTDSPVSLERRLAWARWAHLQMPLTLLYGPQPLRLVGLERYLAEGRWAT
jgi:hypothetical protein